MYGVATGYCVASKTPRVDLDRIRKWCNVETSYWVREVLHNHKTVLVLPNMDIIAEEFGLPLDFFANVHEEGHSPRGRAVLRQLIRMLEK